MFKFQGVQDSQFRLVGFRVFSLGSFGLGIQGCSIEDTHRGVRHTGPGFHLPNQKFCLTRKALHDMIVHHKEKHIKMCNDAYSNI